MLDYLKKAQKVSGILLYFSTIKELKSEKKAGKLKAGSEDEKSSDEEEDEPAAVLPAKKSTEPKIRKAISAEAYGDWNKKEDFKPRVIPKNEDQKTK
jgi:cAMP-dependent protein kinase regulator